MSFFYLIRQIININSSPWKSYYNLEENLISANKWPWGFKSPWTPAEMTTAWWFDASDSSTVVLDASGNIEKWDDKSGNDRHAEQSNSTYRPDYTDSTAVFDGGDEYLTSLRSYSTPDARSTFIVGSIDGGSGTRRFFAETYGGTYGYTGVSVEVGTDDRLKTYIRETAGVLVISDTTDFPAGLQIISSQHTNGSSFNLYLNGELVAYNANATAVDNNFDGLRIGTYREADARFLDGSIKEIIILDTDPNETTRQIIEGYLAHKWGLEANLAADHPYKNIPPY